jgi:hydrogenase expression/formation protein HypC
MTAALLWGKSLLRLESERKDRNMCLAVPGKLLDIRGSDPFTRTGRVSFGGSIREVNLAFVPEAAVGQYLIVHAGVAISIIDEDEAKKVFQYLEEINRLGQDPDGKT